MLIARGGVDEISLGLGTVVNAGLLEGASTSALIIDGAVNNTGLLRALGGGLTIDGAVTGSGAATIAASTLTFGSGFNENVHFVGGSGSLVLAQSADYHGAVFGFSQSGGTSLDLEDIRSL